MDISVRYNGPKISIKGRSSSTLTTVTDVGGCNILLNQSGLLNIASTIDISSSAVEDTALGVGAQTVKLLGLGAGGVFQTETISLAGRTVVTSSKTWYRVFFAQVTTKGTTGYNVGDIYVIKTGTGGTYSAGVPGTFTIASALLKMLAIANQGGTAFYTTPADSTGEYQWQVKKMDVSSSLYGGMAFIQVQDFLNGTPYTREWYVNIAAGVPATVDLSDYQIFVGPLTDIRVQISTTSAASGVNAGLIIERSKLAGIGIN